MLTKMAGSQRYFSTTKRSSDTSQHKIYCNTISFETILKREGEEDGLGQAKALRKGVKEMSPLFYHKKNAETRT